MNVTVLPFARVRARFSLRFDDEVWSLPFEAVPQRYFRSYCTKQTKNRAQSSTRRDGSTC